MSIQGRYEGTGRLHEKVFHASLVLQKLCVNIPQNEVPHAIMLQEFVKRFRM